MKPKHQRLLFISVSLLFLCISVLLTLRAFRDNIVFFFSPSELASQAIDPAQRLRIGGLVEEGSIVRQPDDAVRFAVTDGQARLEVTYDGILPNLFREGQGVVAEGYLAGDGRFKATNILAKHDEKYMPREVVESLKRSGHWQDGASPRYAMTAEIGLFCLILALCIALFQASYLLPSRGLKALIAPCLPSAAWGQALCITLALATLIILRLQSDFSVANVIAHSNRTLPTLYKVAGTWGNHEGSMLLWVWVLAGFGSALALYHTPSLAPLIRLATATQGLICAGALLFILFTSNPFERVFPPTADGEALNPLLQDIALSIHPPLLYLGYVGFSIVFSLAAAALLQGRMDRRWAETAHPWILASWSALTLGIGLGSWWAYRVLGWGGFWFWDPVENASLLPWLSGTALLHANIVLRKREMLAQWVALLSIVTFGMSLLGTFLVRSGALVSVHSFANDPQRGVFILIYMALLLGWALTLFALKGGRIASGKGMLPLSREGMIVINNLFLLTASGTILLGTLYPMAAEWISGDRLSVGAPYFNSTALPLLAVPLLLAGLTPFMPWKKAGLYRVLKQASPAIAASLAGMLLVLALSQRHVALAALGIGLALWLAVASLRWLLSRAGGKRRFPVFLGHAGAALLVAGVTGAGLWKEESERWMAIGETAEIAGYHLTLDAVDAYDDANYKSVRASLSITGSRRQALGTLTPEYRLYLIRNSGSSITSIHPTLWGDLYGVIGEPAPDTGKLSVKLYHSPMIGLLWAGFVLMALGGAGGIASHIPRNHRNGNMAARAQ